MARLSQPERCGNWHGLMARGFTFGGVRFWTRGLTTEHSVLRLNGGMSLRAMVCGNVRVVGKLPSK
jgi:hypothetical protein